MGLPYRLWNCTAGHSALSRSESSSCATLLISAVTPGPCSSVFACSGPVDSEVLWPTPIPPGTALVSWHRLNKVCNRVWPTWLISPLVLGQPNHPIHGTCIMGQMTGSLKAILQVMLTPPEQGPSLGIHINLSQMWIIESLWLVPSFALWISPPWWPDKGLIICVLICEMAATASLLGAIEQVGSRPLGNSSSPSDVLWLLQTQSYVLFHLTLKCGLHLDSNEHQMAIRWWLGKTPQLTLVAFLSHPDVLCVRYQFSGPLCFNVQSWWWCCSQTNPCWYFRSSGNITPMALNQAAHPEGSTSLGTHWNLQIKYSGMGDRPVWDKGAGK